MRSSLSSIRFEYIYRKDKWIEKFWSSLAGKLPRKLAYYAYIRVGVHATTGPYSNTVVPDITMMEALQRWEIS